MVGKVNAGEMAMYLFTFKANTLEAVKAITGKGKRMRLEKRLNELLPDWPSFRIQFHELWGDGQGGWSVNDSWTAFRVATREQTIGHLRSRWEVFKLNYLPKARVKDLHNELWDGDDQSPVYLEVDCVAFATLRKGE